MSLPQGLEPHPKIMTLLMLWVALRFSHELRIIVRSIFWTSTGCISRTRLWDFLSSALGCSPILHWVLPADGGDVVAARRVSPARRSSFRVVCGLGLTLLREAWPLRFEGKKGSARKVHRFSQVYPALLLLARVVDRLTWGQGGGGGVPSTAPASALVRARLPWARPKSVCPAARSAGKVWVGAEQPRPFSCVYLP